MQSVLIIVVMAAVLFLLVSGFAALGRSAQDKADRKVRDRLRALGLENADDERVELVRRSSSMSDVPWFNRMLENMKLAANLRRLIRQADAKGTPGTYMLASALLGLAGLYAAALATGNPLGSAVIAYVCGSLPVFMLKRKKAKRMERFTQQLPEALDLMTRALKAGHTFNGAMRMVADEFDDPIGAEFRQTLEEINYGKDADQSLTDLLHRVDCPDLKFFVVSVNIQRETGGNLAEIISNIARLVRERFELFGQVRVLSAEGRMSAMILTALPFVVASALYIINPEYMSLLYKEELGRAMAMGAVVSMTLGIFVIRRMIRITI
jgi:tight adherence protein B